MYIFKYDVRTSAFDENQLIQAEFPYEKFKKYKRSDYAVALREGSIRGG